MNVKIIALLVISVFFADAAMALNTDEWVYKEKTEHLKSSPGCDTKEAAIAMAKSPYRFNKYTQLICQHEGYGWTVNEIKNPGTPICDECQGADKGKYSCYLSDVTVQCKMVKRGF
jgi:hypothetical protein